MAAIVSNECQPKYLHEHMAPEPACNHHHEHPAAGQHVSDNNVILSYILQTCSCFPSGESMVATAVALVGGVLRTLAPVPLASGGRRSMSRSRSVGGANVDVGTHV